MSRFHIPMQLAAAAALAGAIGVAGAPAQASEPALTNNALNSSGSTLGDLNGVAVEAVTLPEENADNSRAPHQGGTLAPGALVAFEPN
jgi:hypothetical protein